MALSSIRKEGQKISAEVDALTSNYNMEMRVYNNLVNVEKYPKNHKDCLRLLQRAEKWKRLIDPKKTTLNKMAILEESLQESLDKLVTSGFDTTVDPEALDAMRRAKKLAANTVVESDYEVENPIPLDAFESVDVPEENRGNYTLPETKEREPARPPVKITVTD